MGFRGTSLFVVVTWLCSSACNIYHGDSLRHEQREQPATAKPELRNFRNFEVIGVRSPPAQIDLRLDNASAPSTQPPVAGTQAPPATQGDNQAGARAQQQPAATKDDADAGPAPEHDASPGTLDTGRREADAGMRRDVAQNTPQDTPQDTPQKIETGTPERPVARASAACRGELGFETDGRCYFVLDTPVSWNVARDHCYEHDAHLASVTSEQESEVIASFGLRDDVWIGFNRFGAANFSWLTNESGSYSHWKPGAPHAMQESGALIAASTGLWTNRAVSELHAALCETEPATERKRR